jgi:FeS assembly SUF system protein
MNERPRSRLDGSRFDDGKDLFDFMPGRPEEAEIERPEPGEVDPALEEQVVAALKTVRDPELPVNLVDLGLIYELEVTRGGSVYVEMTLTAPSCPVAGSLPGEVERAIRAVPGVDDVRVKLVWTPPWTQERMSEEARLELGLL